MTYDREKILELFKNAPLSPLEPFTEEHNWDVLSSNPALSNNYTGYHGATRFVLVPDDKEKDFVIKIPYNDNQYAPGHDWDYCATEEDRYYIAEEKGMSKYFAKIEFVGYVNNYPIYVQEKCIMNIDYVSSVNADEIHETRSLSPYRGIDPEWLTAFRLTYGKEAFFRFINFIQDLEWDDDLYYNVGFLNDLPVVVDYASYCEPV